MRDKRPVDQLQTATAFSKIVFEPVVHCNYLAHSASTPRSGCPINAAVEVFGDRWTLLVLRDVMFGNRRHFNELLARSEEGIASNVLADRLQRLVRDGLLTREEARRGQKARYSLTAPAIELVPVLAQLGAWGLRHRPTDPELQERAQALADGGPERCEQFMRQLRQTHLRTAST